MKTCRRLIEVAFVRSLVQSASDATEDWLVVIRRPVTAPKRVGQE